MNARIGKYAAAIASIVMLVASGPVVSVAGPGPQQLACQSSSCGG